MNKLATRFLFRRRIWPRGRVHPVWVRARAPTGGGVLLDTRGVQLYRPPTNVCLAPWVGHGLQGGFGHVVLSILFGVCARAPTWGGVLLDTRGVQLYRPPTHMSSTSNVCSQICSTLNITICQINQKQGLGAQGLLL